ncbi:hypothetical protein SSP35_14_01610 [Streptomyces sp. NBRC 110611]|nr:hypothetical protein SSP35_14_01610 [Streptomyces sp. NBRC 110611]
MVRALPSVTGGPKGTSGLRESARMVKRASREVSGHHGGADRGKMPGKTPEEILDRRFAPGEIDADTYSEARSLAGHRPRPQ